MKNLISVLVRLVRGAFRQSATGSQLGIPDQANIAGRPVKSIDQAPFESNDQLPAVAPLAMPRVRHFGDEA